MATALWALGIATALGVAYCIVVKQDTAGGVPLEKYATRNVLWASEDYKDTIGGLIYTKNRFAQEAQLVGVSPGENEIPQYEYELNGARTRVYRLPTIF